MRKADGLHTAVPPAMRALLRLCSLVVLLIPAIPTTTWAADPILPLPTPVPKPTPLEPTPAPTTSPDAPPPPKTRFIIDPITDFGLIGLSIGFSGVLEAIIGTGELTPQQPTDKSRLLSIDRATVTRSTSKNAPLYSNLGLGVFEAYALIEPLVAAYKYGGETGLVDGVLFAESFTLSWSAANLAKIAVRRPRPLAYQLKAEQDKLPPAQRTNISATDTSLSFFSSHAAMSASIGATATYIAFSRAPGTPWPWVTLGISTALTTFVSYERVAAGKHFPTDVISGAMAGTAIGLMVPHLHREQTTKQRQVWVGGLVSDRGGNLWVQGQF